MHIVSGQPCLSSDGVAGGWVWENGHDTLSRLVNLAVSLDSCDSAACIVVCHRTYGTLNWTQFVHVSFEATLLVDGLPGVLWDRMCGLAVFICKR